MPATWTAPKTWANDDTIPEGDLNTHVRDNLLFLKENILLEEADELTIAAGSVTVTKSYHSIDTGGGASEDLTTIAGGTEGRILYLRANHTDRTVVLKNGANLILGADISLDDIDKHVALICDAAGNWHLLFSDRDLTFTVNAFQYPAPGTDWTPDITGATLATNKAAKKCWLSLNFLKIGDQIISYKIVGDMHEEGGDTCTFDCKLVRVNKADALTTTDVPDGDIVTVVADGNFDSLATLTALEPVITDKQYLLELLGTTSNASTNEFIKVIGAEVVVRRLT